MTALADDAFLLWSTSALSAGSGFLVGGHACPPYARFEFAENRRRGHIAFKRSSVTPAQAGVHPDNPGIQDGPYRASLHLGALVHPVRQIPFFNGMTNAHKRRCSILAMLSFHSIRGRACLVEL